MPDTRHAAQTSSARNMREVRAHYRDQRYLVKRNGRDYNLLLDNPGDPRNIRHWAHGSLDGYRTAGCKCLPRHCQCPSREECTCTDSCALAGSRASKAEAANRLANRLNGHRATVAVMLAKLPNVDAQTAAAGAQTVVATHRVVSGFRGTVAYQDIAIRLALRDWGTQSGRTMGHAELTDLTNRLMEELKKR